MRSLRQPARRSAASSIAAPVARDPVEELDVAGRAAQRRSARLDRVHAERFERRAHLAQDRGVHGRIAHDAAAAEPVAAGFELRLHQRDHRAVRAQIRDRARHDRAQRDERRVDDDQIEAAGKRIVGEQPEIRPLDHGHARILAQLPGQLSVADVERDDRARAVREQRIGEAAGRSADVEHVEAGRIERKRRQRPLELFTAAADVARRHIDDRPRPRRARSGPGLVRGSPSTRTRPARIMPRACERVSSACAATTSSRRRLLPTARS